LASGTNFAQGGATIVGEQGPEIVNMPRGAQVFNAGETAQMMGGGTTVNVTIMAQDVGSFRASQGQVAAQLARAVRTGQGRL